MRIITISREFGSGGRELGKRLADLLACDYYDSEIVHAVAQKSGMDAGYVADTLSNHGWQDMALTFRGTLSSPTYFQASKVALLLQQKKVLEEIAALGKDCVIVGRNADVILKDYAPFNIFVCASTEAKVQRCQKELLRKMKKIDEVRAQTRAIMSDAAWGQRSAYHITINTTGWDIKALVPAVADFAGRWFERKK